MNLSTHVAVGAAVGYFAQDPVVGLLAGIVSHHLIDAIPHTDGGSLHVNVKDYAKDKRILAIVGFDMLVLFAIVYLIWRLQGFYPPIVFGALGGALPDLVDNMPFWSPTLRKIFPFNLYHRLHEYLHFTITNVNYLWTGVLTQMILILVSLKLLI